MRSEYKIKRDFSILSPGQLETYLQADNWNNTDTIPRRISVWRKDDKEILVPQDKTFSDYSHRIYEALSTLAALRNVTTDAILLLITTSFCDTLKIRVNSADQISHNIKLDKGVELLENAQKLLLSSARAAIQKKSSYRGKIEQEAQAYMQDVELGQTEAGSYIVTILSPLHLAQMNLDDNTLNAGLPYERKVLETLESAINELDLSAEDYLQNHNISCFESAVTAGVSKNLCEAVALIASCSPHDDIELKFNWSPLLRKKEPTQVIIRHRIIPAVAKAIEYYEKLQRFLDVEIIGFVNNLHRETLLQDTGTIIIKAKHDGLYKNVRLEVTPENHQIAIEAYEQKKKVMCKGTLYKKGRYWHLEFPSDLEIV